MADFCNQCARDLGLPEGDLSIETDEVLEPGYGYPGICETCGFIVVDKHGNCIDQTCSVHSDYDKEFNK